MTQLESVVARRCRSSVMLGRICGPLLDRIDIHVDVPAVKFRDLAGDWAPDAESSETIRERVIKACEVQRQRLLSEKLFSNSSMTPRLIRRCCRIDSESEKMLERANDASGFISAGL